MQVDIIRQGYGFAYTRFPFKHLEEFMRLEEISSLSKIEALGFFLILECKWERSINILQNLLILEYVTEWVIYLNLDYYPN